MLGSHGDDLIYAPFAPQQDGATTSFTVAAGGGG